MTQTDHNTGSSPSLTELAADGHGRDDAGVLLELKPPIASGLEKAGQNPRDMAAAESPLSIIPLLGTIFLR